MIKKKKLSTHQLNTTESRFLLSFRNGRETSLFLPSLESGELWKETGPTLDRCRGALGLFFTQKGSSHSESDRRTHCTFRVVKLYKFLFPSSFLRKDRIEGPNYFPKVRGTKESQTQVLVTTPGYPEILNGKISKTL